MTKYLYKKILKYFLYFLFIFLLFVLQSVPGLLDYCSVSPILVLPACICIAVYEGELPGGIMGFFAGILCDSASETVFGFNAFFYLVLCVTASLVVIYLLRKSTLNIMLISLAAILVRSFMEYFFKFQIYGYESAPVVFFQSFGPQIAYSAIFVLPFCLIIRYVHERFEPESQQ